MIDVGDVQSWFGQRLPGEWFTGAPTILADRDEILVVGVLPSHERDTNGGSCSAFIDRFREDTRDERIRIAVEAEARFGRHVSWGAECHEMRHLFTGLAVPAMTRLRLPERSVLDTLIAAGVARSRSDALAWCVRLVAANQDAWLKELRQALTAVESLRTGGPRPN
jgi:hypothetical protein